MLGTAELGPTRRRAGGWTVIGDGLEVAQLRRAARRGPAPRGGACRRETRPLLRRLLSGGLRASSQGQGRAPGAEPSRGGGRRSPSPPSPPPAPAPASGGAGGRAAASGFRRGRRAGAASRARGPGAGWCAGRGGAALCPGRGRRLRRARRQEPGAGEPRRRRAARRGAGSAPRRGQGRAPGCPAEPGPRVLGARGLRRGGARPAMSAPAAARKGFYRQEVTKTAWEVRVVYQDLQPVGSGAYGAVW